MNRKPSERMMDYLSNPIVSKLRINAKSIKREEGIDYEIREQPHSFYESRRTTKAFEKCYPRSQN